LLRCLSDGLACDAAAGRTRRLVLPTLEALEPALNLEHQLAALLGLAVAAACAPAGVHAAPVAVVNASFEATVLAANTNSVGIPGWVNSTGGILHPLIGPAGQFSNPIPDGVNTAWLNGGSATQTLNIVLAADTNYTLQVAVGDRRDNVFPGYSVALLAGNTVLVTESALHPDDGFLDSVIRYSATAGSPGLGLPLAIRLTANGTQVNFDNVRLDATPVPEPGAWALMLAGIATLGGLSRRGRC